MTRSFDLMDSSTETILLARVQQHIDVAFPDAKISGGGDDPTAVIAETGSVLFRIRTGRELRVIEVTEQFLDADGGIDDTLQRLESWNLTGQLRRLTPNNVLVVGTEGLSMKPNPSLEQ